MLCNAAHAFEHCALLYLKIYLKVSLKTINLHNSLFDLDLFSATQQNYS